MSSKKTDVKQFIKQKMAESSPKEPGSLVRKSNATYKPLNERFQISQSKDELVQYATFYYQRLNSLKPQVLDAAQAKWRGAKTKYMDNILDIKAQDDTVIIGTLFKEMAKKPCVLQNLLGVLQVAKVGENYCSDEDTLVIEDSSGRIKVKPDEENFKIHDFVTGSIVALRGHADLNGLFIIKDYCYAGVPYIENLPSTVQTTKKKLKLYEAAEQADDRDFIMLVSGLEFGFPDKQFLSYELLLKFMRGEFGSAKDQNLSKLITRVVLCGNSTIQPDKADEVLRGSFRTQDLNKKVYASIDEVLD